MSNNLPIYPLLRRGRNVDIIVCFDASADIKQENWLSVAEGYAKQRGIRGWPVGAGWPRVEDETNTELDAADAGTAQQAAGKIAERREEQRGRSQDNANNQIANNGPKEPGETDLTFCNGKYILRSSHFPAYTANWVLKRVWGFILPYPYVHRDKYVLRQELTPSIVLSLGWYQHGSQERL